MTKIRITPSRGEMPRVAPQLLPPEAAQVAVNARLLSGDLEAWREPGFAAALYKSGAVRTIHLMARQHWLHWTAGELGAGAVSVDVARGPISGDAGERTYFTGTDAPRVTDIARAIGACAQAYPCDSLLLGVPAPIAAPELRLDAAEPDASLVPLLNAGAETGGTAGWIVDEGDLGVHGGGSVAGMSAQEGEYWFHGGAVARTAAHQTLLLVDADVFPQQRLELHWWQASGAGGGQGAMGLEFYNESNVRIGDTTMAPLQAITPAQAWTQRSLGLQVPAEAHTLRLLMVLERGGGTDNDAWIDAISLSASDYENAWNGENLDGWTKGPSGPITMVTIDNAFGRPAPSWRFQQNNSVSYVYKDIGLDVSPSARVRADIYTVEQFAIPLYASADGTGFALAVGRDRSGIVSLARYGSWRDESGATIETLSTQGARNQWCQVDIRLETVSAGTAKLKASVTSLASGTKLVENHEAEIEICGPCIGFRSRSNETSERSWVDNVSISVVAPEPDRPENIVYANYVQTFCNEYGEEGPPGPHSRTIQRNSNAPVELDTPVTAPAGYGITHKCLYRSATGASGTAYQLLAKIPLAQQTWVDHKPDADLGRVLESQLYDLPPADLRGLLAMPNRFLAGFAKNELVFSAQGRYHAFPLDYRLATDHPIVAIGAIDASLVVLTESHPYVATGYAPEAMSMQKLEVAYACCSKRSVANLKDFGIVYASPDGLVAINGGGAPLLLTEGLLTREQWQALNPSSLLGVAHDDRYFGFYEKIGGERGGFILDARSGGFGLVFLDLWAEAACSDPLTDRLLLAMDGEIRQWEGGAARRPYRWRSRLFQLPRPTAFGCAQVRAADYADLTLTLHADGAAYFSRAITSATEFVLPDRIARESLEIELMGTSRVQSVEVAEEVEDLE